MIYTVKQNGLEANSENFEVPEFGNYMSGKFRTYRDALGYLNMWLRGVKLPESIPTDKLFFIGLDSFEISTEQ